MIAAGNDSLFGTACAALGSPGMAADPRFGSNELRAANQAALTVDLEAVLAPRPAGEWLALLEAADVPCAPINDMAAVVADPQVTARNMLVTVPDGLVVAGNPIKLSGVDDPTTRRSAPALDGDRAAILAELAKFDEP